MTTTVKGKKTPKTKKTLKTPRAERADLVPAYVDPVHKANVDALRGCLSDMPYSVDDYLREKHAGVDAENAMAEQIRRELEQTGREWSVDDYLREKYAGIDAENAMAEENRRRWENAK